MLTWQEVWREGFAKVLSTAELTALRDALKSDNANLIQGATTSPPPLECVRDWPCEAACLIGFACWQGNDPVMTVAEVSDRFAEACAHVGRAGCRVGDLLTWWDNTPRAEARAALLPLVEEALAAREVIA